MHIPSLSLPLSITTICGVISLTIPYRLLVASGGCNVGDQLHAMPFVARHDRAILFQPAPLAIECDPLIDDPFGRVRI